MLQKMKIPVNLGQGVDTKTDQKHVMPGKLTVLENGVFQKQGSIDKRFGHTEIPNEILNGTELPVGDALATFNDELLQYNNQRVYSFSPGGSYWVDKGSSASVIVDTRSVIRNNRSQVQTDSAILNGVGVYAWEDSTGGLRASVIDEKTGTPMLVDVEISATGSNVRCLAFQSYLFVFYYDSGSLFVRRVNPTRPDAFDAAYEVFDDINTTDPNYDVYDYDGIRILWAANRQTGDAVRAGWLNVEPELLTGILDPIDLATESADEVLSIVRGNNNQLYFLYANDTNGLRCKITNNGLQELQAPFNVVTNLSRNYYQVTGYAVDGGIEVIYSFFENLGLTSIDNRTNRAVVNDNGTSEAEELFKTNVRLVSKAFSVTGSDNITYNFVTVVFNTPLQATYFTIRNDGLIVAKLQYGTAGGNPTKPILANVNEVSPGKFRYAILRKDRLLSEGGEAFTTNGVASTSIDFSNEDIFQTVQLGNNTLIAGGILNMYDGHSVVEHGFHYFPESVISSVSDTPGTIPENTSVSVVFLYEWMDNYGQIHRSAPSPVTTVDTNSIGNDTTRFDFRVQTMTLTAKDGVSRVGVRIVGYLLDQATNTYYRFTPTTGPVNNDVTTEFVTVSLSEIPTDLTSNEILYTTGGIVENIAPPASTSIEVFKNRIFLAGLEEENQAWYSKENRVGAPVEFNDSFSLALESEGGRTTSMGVLDDKLIFFKKDRFYFTFGDGPNDLGAGGDFAEPQFVTADVGAVSNVSVIRAPQGLMFKSLKGIYLCNSSLQVAYIGSSVEDFNSATITSATLVQSRNQVRFTTNDSRTLVYDYYFDRWSTFTQLQSKGALIWDGSFVILRELGGVLRENENKFKDEIDSYGLKLETGWLAVDGVAGFQRVYKMFINGEYKSPHKIRVKVGYDYSPAYESSVVFDPKELIGSKTYGEDGAYGASSPYGGKNNAYRFDVAMKRQKCAAIRFLIEELSTPEVTNSEESLSISDITLLVGVKAGLTKMRTALTVGAKN